MTQSRHNARYAKLRSIICSVKRFIFKQLKMSTVAKGIQWMVDEGIIAESCIGARLCFQDFCTICSGKERKINVFEYSRVVAKQDNRDILTNAFFAVSISCYLGISLVNDWVLTLLQIFLFWNFYHLAGDIAKCIIKRNFHG